MNVDRRFTTITNTEFEAAWASCADRSEKDYRAYHRGPLIQFAKTGGKVTHMRYVGGHDPKALRCN